MRKSADNLKSAVSFTVYGNAAPAGSKTAGIRGDGSRFVRDSSKASAPWKKEVKNEAVNAMEGRALLDCPLGAIFTFYVPRTKGHFNTKGELNSTGLRERHPTKRPDVLKLARAVEDALTGIVYRDDSQIVDEHIVKLWGEPARVHVTIIQV